jgi:type I restriction enzyme S subunit
LTQGSASFGSTHRTIYQADAAGLSICVPTLDEQHAIVDYLDRETARLHELPAAKERVLVLLAEKRRALITLAVTRGLDTRVPLRDSGILWLGEIPAHWGATRLKFVAEVRGGLTLGKRYEDPYLVEFPYLRVANVQDGHLDLADVATVRVPISEAESCLLQMGDVLMNEGGDADKLGRGCVWPGEIAPCLHQNHVFAVRPILIRSDWLNAWTSTESAKAFFESRAKQSTNLASISATNIKELPIPVPPPDEQHAIVAHIATESARLDALRGAIVRSIALLKERRAALIAAAVTGQIDVERAA